MNNFFGTGRDDVQLTVYRWLLAVALLGALLFAQGAWAEEWEFDLTIEETSLLAFDGQVPGTFLRVNKGDDIIVHVKNNTSFKHAIRWHGTYQMEEGHNDGAPKAIRRLYSIQKAIEGGKTLTYRWKVEKSGTFWSHCHVHVNDEAHARLHDGTKRGNDQS